MQHISSEVRCENQKIDVAPFCTLHFVKKVARACVEHIIQRTSTALRVEKMDIESRSSRTPESLTRCRGRSESSSHDINGDGSRTTRKIRC